MIFKSKQAISWASYVIMAWFCTTHVINASSFINDNEVDRDQQFLNRLTFTNDSSAAQQRIRFYAKGSREEMQNLFLKASYPQTKIFIANAYSISLLTKDDKKNFSHISSFTQLETWPMASKALRCLKKIIFDIYPYFDQYSTNCLACKIFSDALQTNTIFAKLLDIMYQRLGKLGFVQAGQLRPYILFSNPEFKFYYGLSLFMSSPLQSKLYYEGLSVMHDSGLLKVRKKADGYINCNRQGLPLSFTQKKKQVICDVRVKMSYPRYVHCDGAHSKIDKGIPLSPIGIFNCCQIDNFINLAFVFKPQKLIAECEIQANIRKFYLSKKAHRSGIVYDLGTITIDTNTYVNHRFKLCQTFRSNLKNYDPLIQFCEDFLTRSGSPYSLINLLYQLKFLKKDLGI